MAMINSLNSSGIQMGVSPASDPITKSLQNQIIDLQKQLQELSSNETMSVEEKLKKQQEIQMQIADLNNQLRQHQMDLRKGKVEKAASDSSGQQAAMNTMISAEALLKQAKMQGSLSDKMEKRAAVLKSEMGLDTDHGVSGSIESKKKELARAEQAALDAKASQMQSLGEANKELEEGKKAEETKDKTDKTEEPAKKTEDEAPHAELKKYSMFYTNEGKMAEDEPENKISVRA